MLRDTAREGGRSSSLSHLRWAESVGYIFLFQPLRPSGTPPIFPYGNTPQCCGTRQGERRVTSIISTEGLFKTSSCRHAPQLSPIFCCEKTPLPCCGTRQGERRVTSIISTEGLFKISSRRHAPRLSPIFCCVKTLRRAEGNGRGGGWE